jgi:hypothetical protein
MAAAAAAVAAAAADVQQPHGKHVNADPPWWIEQLH